MGAEEVIEIYTLSHPETGEIRYVGKAKSSKKRLTRHLIDSRRRDTPVYRWIRKLTRSGLIPTISVVEVVAGSAWQDAERRIIAEYRLKHRLLNVSAGGDQPFCSAEVRAANGRKAVKARTRNKFRRKLFRVKQLLGMALKDGYCSETVKQKMRYAARKRPDLFGVWATV